MFTLSGLVTVQTNPHLKSENYNKFVMEGKATSFT